MARGVDGEFDPNKTPFVRQFYKEGKVDQWSYGVIYDTLERSGRYDIGKEEEQRFFRAVETGVDEEIFDQDKANGFVQNYLKAQSEIDAGITEDESIEKISKMNAKERDMLIETYGSQTQRKIRSGVRKAGGGRSLDEILR